jgi:hypothetical protein
MVKKMIVATAALLLCIPGVVFPAEGESLAKEIMSHDVTFITYYPSPHGIYRKMQSSMMTVGNIDGKTSINDADFPSGAVDGQLYIGRSVVFKPQTGSSLPVNSQIGEVVYNQTDGLWVSSATDGSAWAKVGGSSGSCYTSYGPNEVNNQICLPDFTNKGSLGDWGLCGYGGYFAHFRPAGASCSDSWYNTTRTQGKAWLCCQ